MSENIDDDIVKKCLNQIEISKLVSLPLQFSYLAVDILSKQFTKLNSPHEHRIHYLGPRYTNTQTLHKKCSYNQLSPVCLGTPHKKITKYRLDVKRITNSFFINERLRTNHFYKTGLYYRAFEGMNPTLQLNKQFIFDGSFQSANLDCVIKVKEKQFDLFLRVDSNTRGHCQWFYFSISNGNKKQKIKINLCNISKPGTFYELQMQPYVFSRHSYQNKKQQWTQGSPQITNVSFCQKAFEYKVLADKVKMQPYCYSFEYEFQYQSDEVFFCYCIPYTYSQLLADIEELPKQLVYQHKLGQSFTGVQIPLLHISDHSVKNPKRNILITGRIHPGQSNGSHVLNGFIKFLCSSQKGAIQLRRTANFYIIPMLNPDGVIIGNSRCSASGRDLNRIFPSADKQLFPQIYCLKLFAANFINSQQIIMYFDFHGHSRKKNTFFYGPAYPLSHPNYIKCRVLPRIIQKINCSFRYFSCNFLLSESKKSTGRAAMFETFHIPYTYTVQSSIGYYYDSQQLKTYSFNRQAYLKMGSAICEGTSIYIIALDEYDFYLKQRRAQRERKRNMKMSKRNDGRIQFQQDQLQQSKAPTLKIHYRQSSKQPQDCLFIKLMQQIKTLPQISQRIQQQNKQSTQLDKQISSDQHDQKQDFQITKLKQFNNLIIQNARKDNLITKLQQNQTNYLQNNDQNNKLFIRSSNLNTSQNITKIKNNFEQDQQQMQLMQKMNIKVKPKTSQGNRIIKTNQIRSTARSQFKRYNYNKIYNSNINNNKKQDQLLNNNQGQQAQFTILHRPNKSESRQTVQQLDIFYIQKSQNVIQTQRNLRKSAIRTSTFSRSTTGNQKQKFLILAANLRKHHFSQIHFPEQDKAEQKRLMRHQKTDLFRRNIERKRQRQDKQRIQSLNCSQVSILKPPKKQPQLYQNLTNKTIKQFKMQQLLTSLQYRSKMLKDSVKYKQSSQMKMKSNCMFPSSFYCIRQQINTKKRTSSYSKQHNQSYNVDQPLSINIKKFYK